MAGKNIKGMTIELNGDSTELQKALRAPEKQASDLQKELTEINKSLRLNPDSIELLSQKSTVLASRVAAAVDKLQLLRNVSAQVQQQAKNGDIGEEQYRAFQRELIRAEGSVRKFQSQLITTDSRIRVLSGDTKSAADSAAVFEQEFDRAQGTMEGMKNKTASLSVAMGNLASKAIQLVIQALKNLSGDAIARYDTLERFPRMLEQMGFEATAAKAATDRLAEGISGLPTTLDDIVTSAQGLTVLTGDLDKSVELSLALNNAFLASGASVSDAARGMQQYNQMLATGAVDMQSWRTLQETMGYALRETAEAMGFAGKSATNDLYKALQNGTVTFDQFNKKLIEMSNKTGGFADTAKKASAGIGNSFSLMKSAVVRGITSIIEALNNNGAIQQTLVSLGEGFENILKVIGDLASVATTILSPAIYLLTNSIGALLQAVAMLTAAFIAYRATLVISSFIQALAAGFGFLEAAMLSSKIIMDLVTIAQTKLNLAMAANPVGLLVAAIAALVIGLIALFNWLGKTKKKQDENAKSAEGLAGSLNTSTKAFGKNKAAAKDAAQAGYDIADSYDAVGDSVKQLPDTIYGTLKEAKEAAKEFNKQFSNSGYKLVLDANGRAKEVRNSSYKHYQEMKELIDYYYDYYSEADKVAISEQLMRQPALLERLARGYGKFGRELGADVARGLAQGIKENERLAENAGKSLAKTTQKAITTELKIQSPSKVTQKDGEYTVAGFVKGILSGRGTVQQAVQSLVNSTRSEMAASVAGSTRQGAYMMAGAASNSSTYNDHSQMILNVDAEDLDAVLHSWRNQRRISRQGEVRM